MWIQNRPNFLFLKRKKKLKSLKLREKRKELLTQFKAKNELNEGLRNWNNVKTRIFFIWNFGNVGHFVNFGETVCLPNFFICQMYDDVIRILFLNSKLTAIQSTPKELSLCPKLRFSYTYIFATQWRRP